ncbi:MAG: FliM/FliN family flagellar motor switch protein [Deltaproteobacteria bacterium]|nr:FliM/FliN family flagellar motor switch protein [Deltaproteobacteria bacterium]
MLPTEVVAVALRTERDFKAVLALPPKLVRRLVDLALGRSARADNGALTSGEEGALLYALDRAGGDWIAASGVRFGLCGVLADAEQAADYLGLEPPWQVSARFTAGSLSDLVWLWLAAPDRAAFPGRTAIRFYSCDLPVSWRVQVGESLVAADELRGLGLDDVVEIDRLCHPLAKAGSSQLRVVSGGVKRPARWLDRRRLELVSTDERRSQMESSPDDSTSVTASLEDALDPELGTMEVRLQVEVGRVAIPLDQALSLLAGAVLELDRDVGPEVQLRVRDRLIARGELVDCEGRLAVQITEVP